jgi:hypothetical protein
MFSQKDFDDAGLGPSAPTQPVIKATTAVDMDPVRSFDRAAKAYRDSNPDPFGEAPGAPAAKPMRKVAEPQFKRGQRVRHTRSGVEATVVHCHGSGESGIASVEYSSGDKSYHLCSELSAA